MGRRARARSSRRRADDVTVYLVGAGPGDPDLLTRRAASLLARADVVIVDRLIDRRLLDEIPTTALVIDVGKHPRDGGLSTSQATINDLLVTHGAGDTVVIRLKGGDPFLFGRGGEEVAACVAAGVTVDVVPGISSALAVPLLAGIPVTHRGVAAAVTIVSGHDVEAVNWTTLAGLEGTLVLLMAVANRGAIARQLLACGAEPSTPVAAIEWGSTPHERRQRGTLATLASMNVDAPAVIVVGAVAAFVRDDEPLGDNGGGDSVLGRGDAAT